MKIPFTVGTVGHFGLAVRDPRRSAEWFARVLGLRKEFEFEGGIAIGNDNVTMVLSKGKPSPGTIGHMSFHLPNMTALRKALEHLKKHKSTSRIPATKSGRRRQAHETWAYGFTIPMATVGNCRSWEANSGQGKQ